MRPQYHSRQTSKGKLVWDVNKLVKLTAGFPAKEVKLSDIKELDENYWFNDDTAEPTCRNIAEHAKLIDQTSLEHPIILSHNGRVMDGMHRICRALINDHKTIKAVQFDIDPEPDYIDINLSDLPY